MPKFKKEILPVGKHLVTLGNGTRQLKEFSADFLGTVVENANKMISNGLRIPAPFRHDEEAVPVSELPETNSYDNAGYWDEFSIESSWRLAPSASQPGRGANCKCSSRLQGRSRLLTNCS